MRHLRLAVPVERPSAARVSGDIGTVGEAVRHDPHFCHSNSGTTTRELDPPPTGDLTGLSIGPIIIHPCGRRLSSVYVAIMSEWIPHRFSVAKRVIRCTIVTICQRHDILHPWILGGCAHLVHHDGYFLGLLYPTIEPSKIVVHWIQTIFGGAGGVL